MIYLLVKLLNSLLKYKKNKNTNLKKINKKKIKYIKNRNKEFRFKLIKKYILFFIFFYKY